MLRPELLLQAMERTNLISGITDLKELLDEIMKLFMDTFKAEAGALYLIDQPDELVVRVAVGLIGGKDFPGRRVALQGLAKDIFRNRKPVISNNGDTHLIGGAEFDHNDLKNALSFPLIASGVPLGIVQLFNAAEPDVVLIEVLADRTACDIEKALASARSQKKIERLETLISNFGEIVSNLDRDQLLHIIITSAGELLDAESSSIFLLDPDTGDLILHMAGNLKPPGEEAPRVPAGKGIIGFVMETGETVITNEIQQDERHYPGVDEQTGFVTRSILAVPLITHQISLGRERGTIDRRIIGGLEAINKRNGNFSEDDAEALRIFANQAGTVLEVTKLYSDANDLFLDAIKAFTTAIDAKDPYTKDHSQRVSEYSVAIGREMGLAGETIHRVRISGLLHDIGKIAIPSNILTKPGRLTDEEFELVKTHPEIGARIVSEIRLLRSESAALSQHHERLDGTGYPFGLNDSEISTIGQIVAIADVFDAMTSDRTYRKAMHVDDVFSYMRSKKGFHFNGDCVEALIRAYQKGRIQTENENSQGS